MAMMVDACLAQHQGDRKEQQDRVALIPHPRGRGVALAVVADGMGGHAGGALAAQQVIYTTGSNFKQFSANSDEPQELLESSIGEAHLLIKASRFINEKDPRSTAVMLVMQPKRVNWAHCGDSRLYWFRGDHCLFCTKDHSYVEDLVAKGLITPEQAAVHPNRNILLTSLGGDEDPRIDYGWTDEMLPGDSFLLCSDGLWGYFNDKEMGGLLANYSAREATNHLIERARKRANGEGDNVSLVVLKILEVEAKKNV